MHKLIALTLLLPALSLTLAAAPAIQPSAPATRPATSQPFDTAAAAKFIGQLGDADFAVREAATQKLIGLGEGVRPMLVEKAGEKGLDAEVAARIPVVIAALDLAAFDIHCTKKDDTITVATDAGRTIFTIKTPSGIGGATINRNGESWPAPLVLRFPRPYMEHMEIKCGAVTLQAGVSSNGAGVAVQKAGQGTTTLIHDGPYWMDILTLNDKGQPATGRPEEGGYFEMVIPQARFAGNPGKLTLNWIDAYR